MSMLTREAIRNSVLDHYAKNDPRHKIDHADSVYESALFIAGELGLRDSIDTTWIALAAYWHDAFVWVSRKMHHQLAYEYIMTTDHPHIAAVGTIGRECIATATLQHRASGDGIYSSDLSQIIAAADRGVPSVEARCKRSYVAGSDNQEIARCVQHLKDKYGSNGYAHGRNQYYTTVYGPQIEQMKKKIDSLTTREYMSYALN